MHISDGMHHTWIILNSIQDIQSITTILPSTIVQLLIHTMYRNRVRSKLHKNNPAVSKNIQKCKHQALLKLVSELGVHKYDTNAAPFSLSNLVKLYDWSCQKLYQMTSKDTSPLFYAYQEKTFSSNFWSPAFQKMKA